MDYSLLVPSSLSNGWRSGMNHHFSILCHCTINTHSYKWACNGQGSRGIWALQIAASESGCIRFLFFADVNVIFIALLTNLAHCKSCDNCNNQHFLVNVLLTFLFLSYREMKYVAFYILISLFYWKIVPSDNCILIYGHKMHQGICMWTVRLVPKLFRVRNMYLGPVILCNTYGDTGHL